MGLRLAVPLSLERASPELCSKFFAKVDWIEQQYRDGVSVYNLETYKQRKSHRTGREGNKHVASYGTHPFWGAA